MWPFKCATQPPCYSASRIHFYSFKPGQKAIYAGRIVQVVFVDDEDTWDDDNLIPEMRIVNVMDDGRIQEITLTPAEALGGLKHHE